MATPCADCQVPTLGAGGDLFICQTKINTGKFVEEGVAWSPDAIVSSFFYDLDILG